jgi:hypothetical protein
LLRVFVGVAALDGLFDADTERDIEGEIDTVIVEEGLVELEGDAEGDAEGDVDALPVELDVGVLVTEAELVGVFVRDFDPLGCLDGECVEEAAREALREGDTIREELIDAVAVRLLVTEGVEATVGLTVRLLVGLTVRLLVGLTVRLLVGLTVRLLVGLTVELSRTSIPRNEGVPSDVCDTAGRTPARIAESMTTNVTAMMRPAYRRQQGGAEETERVAPAIEIAVNDCDIAC